MMRAGLVLGLMLSVGLVATQDERPIVTIAQGTVIGTRLTYGDFEYLQFLSIPYAGSTAGEHRFKAPTAPPLFSELIADRADVKCIHATENGYEGIEDCLVASVYVPIVSSIGNLPVMVWIQGSELQNGEDYPLSFRRLLEQDVIVVTLNYRESIFGFLCLGVEQAPGNAGLKDIIAGLKWVQDNIAAFGGNPESVTLFGHGSGAAAVDLITLSPLSQGLVHKAIAQSGSSLAPWAISYDPRVNAIAVAEKLGHTVSNVQDLADVFGKASIGVLVAAVKELDLTDNTLAFAACVEKHDLDSEEPLFTEPPYEIIQSGNYNQIPYITGFVENEGTVRAYQALEGNWLDKMEISFMEFLQQDLEFPSDDEMAFIADDIRAFYFQGRNVDMTSIGDFIRYHGDTMILVSAIRTARLRAASSQASVYLYQFSYEGPLGVPFVGPLSVEGAAHGEDLAYLFDIGVTTEPGSLDSVVRDILVQRWTNFAKNGIPTADSDVTWSPVTANAVTFLHILNHETGNDVINLEVALENPHPNKMVFWDDLYERHYRQIVDVWEVDGREDDDEDLGPEEEENTDEGNTEEENTDEGEDDNDDNGNNAARNGAFLTSIVLSGVLAMII